MLLQDLSNKQLLSFQQSTARINVWEGAVRSGKSFSSLVRFLQFALEGPAGDFVILGRTQDTIKRNIVSPILEMLGVDVKHSKGNRELHLYGRTIHLVGCADERAEAKIRGPTFSGAYVDEITLIPESAFGMLLSRLSIPGAKLFGTTNPDSPYHWFKRDFLDREGELDLKSWKFKLEDNPSLTEEYKNAIKTEYKGLWYNRFIEGLWVQAEGAIFDFFEDSLHLLDGSPFNARYYVVGIDYGTSNPTAFSLIGYNPENYPHLWLEEEYYWDSRAKQRQKTDSEYAEDLIRFIQGKNVKMICIDPSAASFKAELIKHGIGNIVDANNDVLDGIRFHSKLLSNGTFKICRNCVHSIKEYRSYIWDDKSLKLGIDKPVKQNDHCFVAGTLISTDKGQIPIEEIKIGDKVLTPIGYRKILKTFVHEAEVAEFDILGQKITCTPEHKFYTTNRGWVKAQDLIPSDMFLIDISEEPCQMSPIPWNGMGINTIDPKHPKILVISDITEDSILPLRKTDICIEIFGNSIMEKFHEDVIFITSTKILQTMTLATCNASQLQSIYPNMAKILQQNKDLILESIAKEFDLLRKNSMSQKKGNNGIKLMLKRVCQKFMRKDSKRSVINANKLLKEKNRSKDFVRITVNLNGEESIILMMSLENALTVIKNLSRIDTRKLNSVLVLVDKKVGDRRKVYNITVDGLHVYFACNILSLNCLDSIRYSIMTHFKPIYDGKGEMDVQAYRRWKAEQGWR